MAVMVPPCPPAHPISGTNSFLMAAMASAFFRLVFLSSWIISIAFSNHKRAPYDAGNAKPDLGGRASPAQWEKLADTSLTRVSGNGAPRFNPSLAGRVPGH